MKKHLTILLSFLALSMSLHTVSAAVTQDVINFSGSKFPVTLDMYTLAGGAYRLNPETVYNLTYSSHNVRFNLDSNSLIPKLTNPQKESWDLLLTKVKFSGPDSVVLTFSNPEVGSISFVGSARSLFAGTVSTGRGPAAAPKYSVRGFSLIRD